MNNELFNLLDSARRQKKMKVTDLCRLSKLSVQSWISIKKNDNFTINTLRSLCLTLEIKEITFIFD